MKQTDNMQRGFTPDTHLRLVISRYLHVEKNTKFRFCDLHFYLLVMNGTTNMVSSMFSKSHFALSGKRMRPKGLKQISLFLIQTVLLSY